MNTLRIAVRWSCRYPKCEQSVEEIKQILNKARTPGPVTESDS